MYTYEILSTPAAATWIAFFAVATSFAAILLTVFVKPSLFNQLMLTHQFFSFIVNLVHLIWIYVNYTGSLTCFEQVPNALLDQVLSSVAFFSWYSSQPLVLLLSVVRLSQINPHKFSLDRHSTKIVTGSALYGLLASFVFPFRCSRPYLSVCSSSLEQYHNLKDPLCLAHSIVTQVLFFILMILLPVLLDIISAYKLYKKSQAGGRKTFASIIKVRQLYQGLLMFLGLHVVHSARLALDVYSNYVPQLRSSQFLMNTATWLIQNITESSFWIFVLLVELNQTQKLWSRIKSIIGK